MYYLCIARETARQLSPGLDLSQIYTNYELNLPVPADSARRVDGLISQRGLSRKLLVGLNPGAAHGPAKRWSAQRLGHVADGIARPEWAFVSTASPAEKELNDQVQAECQEKIHRLGEDVSLADLPALIDRLAVLITNDSGAMHIAAARKVPVVAIFGPTDIESTRPWMSPAEVLRHPVACSPCFLRECPTDHRCMEGISSFDAAEATLKMISHALKVGRR
jgi:heptosyltransferase-2